jgi:SAM-dependent methyltransferase
MALRLSAVPRIRQGSRLDRRVPDIGDIRSLPPESFDGIVSCFAALNTQPSLLRFAEDAVRLLKPGGRLIIHLLNSWSLWEWMALVSHGDLASVRALGTRRDRQFTIGGIPVRHYLERSDVLYSTCFESRFRLRGIRGLGMLRPPAGSPRLPDPILYLLGACDVRIGRFRPWCHWGRFTVLDLEVRAP